MSGDLPLLGFGLPVAGHWATPETIALVARRAEALGYASLWTFQRMLCPVEGELEPPHRTVHDSMVALAYVAGMTDRIGLGTATILVRDGARDAGRDPEAVRILVRGVPDLVGHDLGGSRRPLQGTRSQVLDDLASLRAQGVTEVFFDLNLSPRVGYPDVDPAAAVAYAEQVLQDFAPATK